MPATVNFHGPDDAQFGTIVDIIPFGKLETAERTIAWPPDADVVMNVAAFSDVFENALRVEVRPDLVIPVASLPGLAILKLFAWTDRHEARDVQDLRPCVGRRPGSGGHHVRRHRDAAQGAFEARYNLITRRRIFRFGDPVNTIAYCANNQCEQHNVERVVSLTIHATYNGNGSGMRCSSCNEVMKFKLAKPSPGKKHRS